MSVTVVSYWFWYRSLSDRWGPKDWTRPNTSWQGLSNAEDVEKAALKAWRGTGIPYEYQVIERVETISKEGNFGGSSDPDCTCPGNCEIHGKAVR